MLQSDFFRLTEWCKTWQLKFNPDKCETMKITDKQDKLKESYTLDPNGEILKSVKNIKDLGITISYDLSWSDHIHEVVNKVNKVLGVIKRVLGSNSVNEFSLLYKSLVRPILEYAAPVWCRGHCFARKSPGESVETGSRPKEGRNGLRGTSFRFKVVAIKESKTVFFSDRVL